MNTIYPLAREKFLTGALDWSSDDIKVVLLDNTYTYSAAHEFLTDLTGVVATSGNLTGKTTTGGVADADDLTFPALVAGDTIVSVVIYRDTGLAATSDLIIFMGTSASGVAISRITDGNDVVLRWSNAATRIFRL
jgi:hypothetical protein